MPTTWQTVGFRRRQSPNAWAVSGFSTGASTQLSPNLQADGVAPSGTGFVLRQDTGEEELPYVGEVERMVGLDTGATAAAGGRTAFFLPRRA